MTFCGSSCKRWFQSKAERRRCRAIRECACTICSELKAVNKQVHDACVNECQADLKHSENGRDYLCNQIGADAAFNSYGILCGNIEDTTQYKIDQINEKKTAKNKDFLIVGLVVAAVLIYFLIYE